MEDEWTYGKREDILAYIMTDIFRMCCASDYFTKRFEGVP